MEPHRRKRLATLRARRVGPGPWTVTAHAAPVGLHARQDYLTDKENSPKTSVLYNANCPVCNFEIGHYARYAGKTGLPIRFDDLNTDARAQWGLDADTAARRLYVLHDGTLTSGIPAFLVLWAQMPRYRLLGRIVGLPEFDSGRSEDCEPPLLGPEPSETSLVESITSNLLCSSQMVAVARATARIEPNRNTTPSFLVVALTGSGFASVAPGTKPINNTHIGKAGRSQRGTRGIQSESCWPL